MNIVNFEYISHFFSVSIVNFKQVNVTWEGTSLSAITASFLNTSTLQSYKFCRQYKFSFIPCFVKLSGFSKKVCLRFHHIYFFSLKKLLCIWKFRTSMKLRRAKALISSVWSRIVKIWDNFWADLKRNRIQQKLFHILLTPSWSFAKEHWPGARKVTPRINKNYFFNI